MLDLTRYLLGVLELLLLGGFAWLGASAVRARLLSDFTGAPAYLATSVIALALLIWTAELLGSFGALEPVPYLVGAAVVGVGLWFAIGGGRGHPSRLLGFSPAASVAVRGRDWGEKEDAAAREGRPRPPSRGHGPGTTGEGRTQVERGHAESGGGVSVATLIALAIAACAVVKFGFDVRSKLLTGMAGFDSTWYHGPFAAGFFQSGDTWGLHFIAPQFLAWFYPANAEIFHAAGMLAFGRDILSPLLNLGWFVGCLVACWCIGRPYKVAPWSLALGAIALSLPVLSDQAGEARNDIVGIFFLLAAVAITLNTWAVRSGARGSLRSKADDGSRTRDPEPDATQAASGPEVGSPIVVGLAAGLAAGTKLNFLLPAAVLVLGLPLLAPAGRRLRALAATLLAALAGGGYWYLRNLVHTGNPLPWFDHLGPISLPAPEQALGGREGHTVLSYLTDGSVWSEWLLPGLHGGLTILWPLLAGLALAGLMLCLVQPAGPSVGSDSGEERGEPAPEVRKRQSFLPASERVLWVVGLSGIAVIAAWLIAPTSASGPEGMPRGFESGLRYLAPALVLGLTLIPVVLPRWLRKAGVVCPPNGRILKVPPSLGRHLSGRGAPHTRPAAPALVVLVLVAAIAIGYPVQRRYLRDRYVNPSFAAPGLNAAFEWANDISNARIATTGTRQYPLFGRDLTNRVQYIGKRKPHGGFTAPTTCRQWRRLLNEGEYDYAVVTRDRIEPGKPPYPPTARWTEAPAAAAVPVLRRPPTVIFKLTSPLDPSACP